MACEHKRIMSRNCELYCLDCGAKVDAPKPKDERVISASGRKIGFESETKPKRGRKGAKTE